MGRYESTVTPASPARHGPAVTQGPTDRHTSRVASPALSQAAFELSQFVDHVLWVSDVRPGSTHDLTAARELVLTALHPHAARGLPVLVGKGYNGAGVGVHVPIKHHPHGPLHTDNRCYNHLITALRAPTERSNALLGR